MSTISRTANVMVFPCGSEIAMEIHAALENQIHVNLFGASSKEDHGRFVYKQYFGGIPFISDPTFVDSFKHILHENRIDLIFPTHDTVALFLAEHHQELGSRLLTGSLDTCRICREKAKIYDLFANDIFCPKRYTSNPQPAMFPVFMKPNIGEGGRNASKINSLEELRLHSGWQAGMVLTEYLPGDELSVDCFTDRHGKLRFAGPRTRERILAGISVNSRTVPLTPEIQLIADELNSKLEFRGAWFFQIKRDADGRYKLLECAPRIASTMCVYRQIGVNFPLLTVYDAMDIDVQILVNDTPVELDRAFHNCFAAELKYSTVYIDLDDTLIDKQGNANTKLMHFLYQARRKGKKIILLTAHKGSVTEALDRACIHAGLFDIITHISEPERKADFADVPQAIFIDNSFAERAQMKKSRAIPVFDINAVECLLD